MANTKVTSHVIANDAITADQLATAAVTHAKLHTTMDLSGKTVTLPAVAIPSASTATTQSASDSTTKVATTAYVTTAISNLVDSAPAALDTLNEIAAALGDDANYASTTTAAIAAKLPLAGGTLTGNLVLSGAPSSGLHPATKTYTDTADALKLNLSGGTLTGDLILNTTTALKIPVGTTAQRPSAATGQMRWNTSDGALEVYNGSAWTAVGTGSSNKILDTFTGNGSTTAYTLSVTPANEDALIVFIDGVYQEKGDYALSNAVLTLDTAPASGEKLAVHITTASVHDGTSAVNQQFTATNGQTAFTLSADPKSENNTQVYINGVYQQKTDYTVSGTTLTFDTGVTLGDIVEVNMFTVTTLGNTDTVSEGTSNLYHTTARARGAISVSGNALSYNSSTGVITSAYEESPTFTGNVTVPYLATTSYIDLNNSGNRGKIGWSSNHTYIATTSSVGSIIFKNNVGSANAPQTGGDTLLTLADGGNATFAGTITGADGLSIQGGTGNAYLQVGSDTGSWTWKNYRANHKLALEDSDGTGEVLNFDTSGHATFAGSVTSTGLTVSRAGNGQIATLKTSANRGFSFESQSDTALQIASIQGSTNLDLWANTLSFSAGGTESMRIDSSGTLLVGTINGSGAGLEISKIHGVRSTVTNNIAALFDRLSSDGDIALFRKAGSTVGSIGAYNGVPYIGYQGGAGGGIMFNGASIEPTALGASRTNGANDIGSVTYRWRDIYLSGGVNFSGNANASGMSSEVLDDYEEGSWTPALTGSSGTSGTAYTTQSGRYTKVGNVVNATFHILLSNEGTLGGTTRISGLPFNGSGGPNYQTATLMCGNTALDKDQKLTGMQYAVNAFIYLMIEESDVALSQASGNGPFKNNTEISGSVTYFTNS